MTASIGQIIRSRFITQWATFSPTYTLVQSGQPTPTESVNDAPWVKLSTLFGESRQVGFSNAGPRKRTVGNAVVQIFVPAGTGDGLAESLSDRVADVWEMTTIQGVIFRATSVQRVGEDGTWLQYNATTPFQVDELRTA